MLVLSFEFREVFLLAFERLLETKTLDSELHQFILKPAVLPLQLQLRGWLFLVRVLMRWHTALQTLAPLDIVGRCEFFEQLFIGGLPDALVLVDEGLYLSFHHFHSLIKCFILCLQSTLLGNPLLQLPNLPLKMLHFSPVAFDHLGQPLLALLKFHSDLTKFFPQTFFRGCFQLQAVLAGSLHRVDLTEMLQPHKVEFTFVLLQLASFFFVELAGFLLKF